MLQQAECENDITQVHYLCVPVQLKHKKHTKQSTSLHLLWRCCPCNHAGSQCPVNSTKVKHSFVSDQEKSFVLWFRSQHYWINNNDHDKMFEIIWLEYISNVMQFMEKNNLKLVCLSQCVSQARLSGSDYLWPAMIGTINTTSSAGRPL